MMLQLAVKSEKDGHDSEKGEIRTILLNITISTRGPLKIYRPSNSANCSGELRDPYQGDTSETGKVRRSALMVHLTLGACIAPRPDLSLDVPRK